MHFKMIIIGNDEGSCLNLLEQYDHNREVKFDDENNYWYNPDGHYDYYTVGGRFCACLEIKDDCPEFSTGEKSLFSKDDCYQSNKAGVKLVDGAYVKDILNFDSLGGYGYVDSKGWHDAWGEYEKDLYSDFEKKTKGVQEYSPEYESIRRAWFEEENQAEEKFKKKIRGELSKDPSKYVLIVDIHD